MKNLKQITKNYDRVINLLAILSIILIIALLVTIYKYLTL